MNKICTVEQTTQLPRHIDADHGIMEFIPEAYVVTDAAGRIRDANAHALRLLSPSQRTEQVIGRTLLREQDRAQLQERLAELSPGCRIEGWRTRIEAGTNGELDVELTLGGLYNHDQHLRAIQWLIRETAQEPKLPTEYEEDRFHELVDALPQAVWTSTPDGQVDYINHYATEFTGVHVDEFLGHNWVNHLHPNDRDRVLETWRKALETGTTYKADYRVLAKDGVYHWGKACGVPLRDEEGTITKWVGVILDIDDTKQTEESMRRWEERFRLMADASGVLVYDLWFDINQYEPTCGLPVSTVEAVHYLYEFLGYERYEIPETLEWWLSQVHPDDIDALTGEILDAIVTGRDFTTTYRIRHKHGHYLTVSTVTHVIPDRENGRVRFVGGTQDITEYKRLDETLREQEERFRLVAETSGIVVFDLGINLDKTEPLFHFPEYKVNAVHGLVEMLGYSSDEVKLDIAWWFAQIHPADLPEYIRLSLEGFAAVKGITLRYRVRHKQGHYLNVEEVSCIVHDATGRPVRLVGGLRDITERTKIEDALRESEEKFRSVAEHADAPIGIIQGRKFVYANPYLINLSGYTPEEFYQLDILLMVHPDFRATIMDRYRRRLEGDTSIPTRYEYKMITKSGEERWMDIAPVRIVLNGIPSIIGHALDITDRKRVEEALQRAKAELEQRVRERTVELERTVEELRRSNEDLENFAHISSHDLQEPLRMVGNYVGLLASRYRGQLDQDANDFIAYAEEGARRMSMLIKDLLAYSRINTQGRTLAPTDTNLVLSQVLESLKLKIEETNAEVTFDPLPTVCADSTQLGQVFQNLIDNAIKYRRDGVQPKIHITSNERDGQWVFSVHDNGIGIDPQYREKIFLPFQRLHANRGKYPGTGIGLAIVKRIVERHGGRVCLDSNPDEGTTFYFTLPT